MAGLFDDDEIADEFTTDDLMDEAEAEVDAAEPVDLTPRTNPDLKGHEAAEAALLSDYNAGRMPHAIILAGPEGIGKATMAFRIARFLLAQDESAGGGLFGEPEKPSSLYIAPDHPVFRRVASGGHADLLVVEREFDEKKGKLKNDISVDNVRRVHPFLRKTAAEDGWRAVIVDGAESLNANSQNALLKILEEPPSKTILILTTSQPGLFLPTIRSRCRTLRLEPLEAQVVSGLMDMFAPQVKGDEKETVLRLSKGSIGAALRYVENKGAELSRDLLGIAAMLPEMDIVKLHDLADKLGRNGAEDSFETARNIMTGWCANQVRASARGVPVAGVLPQEQEIFRRLSQVYPATHFMDAWEKMEVLFSQTEQSNLDRRQAIIGAFLTLQRPGHSGISL
jgi:DNA polymerase III subunit delta'